MSKEKSKVNIDIVNWIISIFDPHIKEPFNEWTQENLIQGFSWRSNSISFLSLKKSGVLTILYGKEEEIVLLPGCIRAIQVPFRTDSGYIEFGTNKRGLQTTISPGQYALIFQIGIEDQEMWLDLSFIPALEVVPQILICDAAIKVPNKFLMGANPA